MNLRGDDLRVFLTATACRSERETQASWDWRTVSRLWFLPSRVLSEQLHVSTLRHAPAPTPLLCSLSHLYTQTPQTNESVQRQRRAQESKLSPRALHTKRGLANTATTTQVPMHMHVTRSPYLYMRVALRRDRSPGIARPIRCGEGCPEELRDMSSEDETMQKQTRRASSPCHLPSRKSTRWSRVAVHEEGDYRGFFFLLFRLLFLLLLFLSKKRAFVIRSPLAFPLCCLLVLGHNSSSAHQEEKRQKYNRQEHCLPPSSSTILSLLLACRRFVLPWVPLQLSS